MLRNWLFALSERLGVDPGVAADGLTPPTMTPSDDIASLLGKLALTPDATIGLTSDSVTVRVRAVPDSTETILLSRPTTTGRLTISSRYGLYRYTSDVIIRKEAA